MYRVLLFILIISQLVSGQIKFEEFFEEKTLRIDYFHTGTKLEEDIVLDKLIQYDYLALNPKNLVDDLNLGFYLLKVVDIETNQLIYSKGFSSLFNEWQTTTEAIAGRSKVLHE